MLLDITSGRPGDRPVPAEEAAGLKRAVRVSVVVPTYQRDLLLSRLLSLLVRQDLPPESYEILVCDNAGSESTRHLVETFARSDGPVVRYLAATDRRGPAAARNVGWKAARGEIIAFTDDDCVPARDWLSRGLAAFNESVAGVWGRIVVPLPNDPPTDYERDTARLGEAEFVNANCFYRRDVLDEVDGFDERFETAWREDSDLYFRALARGRRMIHDPGALVVHPARPAPWGVSLLQQKKSFFNALLYKKHPVLYRQRIQARPPWRYYVAVAFLAGCALGALSGATALVAVSAASWLGATGSFCATRLAGTSHAPRHVLEMIVTSALIPPLAVFWRLRGAVRFRVWFL